MEPLDFVFCRLCPSSPSHHSSDTCHLSNPVHINIFRIRQKCNKIFPGTIEPVYFVSCRLYPTSLSHHGSVWLLTVISLLLTNTVSRVGVCESIWWEKFRGSQKEDDHWPLSILLLYGLYILFLNYRAEMSENSLNIENCNVHHTSLFCCT